MVWKRAKFSRLLRFSIVSNNEWQNYIKNSDIPSAQIKNSKFFRGKIATIFNHQ
jgi:hypothetical protein